MRAHVCKARKTNMSQSGKKPPTYSMSRSLYDLRTRSRVLLLHTSPFLPCILFIFKNPVSGTFNSNFKSWKIERVHFKYVNTEENYTRFPIFIQENCLKVSFWRHLLCTSSACKLNYEVITRCQLSGRPPKNQCKFLFNNTRIKFAITHHGMKQKCKKKSEWSCHFTCWQKIFTFLRWERRPAFTCLRFRSQPQVNNHYDLIE